jgi:phage tail sheath protein FI
LLAGDFLEVGNTSIGKQFLKISNTTAVSVNGVSGSATFTINFEDNYTLSTDYTSQTVNRYWEFFNAVAKAPSVSDYQSNFGNTAAVDEVHAVVVDDAGAFTGVPGTVLEVFQGMSRATDAKTVDGATNYYKNIINQQSNYIWFINHRSASEANTAVNLATSAFSAPLTLQFAAGTDGDGESNVPMNILAQGYDQFASAESVDVSLVLQGKARGGASGEQLANYIIDNVAEARKDCVAFVSPARDTVVNNIGSEVTDVVAFRNVLRNSSYAFMDTGYKYQYDKYNDIYRYVPLNGDVAGLAVRTDSQRDPWFSPAGFNRGQIKNIIKLAYNPGKAERDALYKADVNPVVTFPGQGTVLFGDKTLLGKPSAFDRINVRRLFIVLEKAIATASKFTLFEFNDGFTRAQFKNLVEPFLRDVQGRRGIYEFKVVCDETNNTGEVIDSNRFVGDIYIKPARSINFIQLNFVAVRTGVQFSEVVGKF